MYEIYIYRYKIEQYKFVNNFVKYQIIICNLLININFLGNIMYTFNKKVVDFNFYKYI